MSILTGATIAGGIAGLGGSAYNMFTANRSHQFQKRVWNETKEREDTAIQRRVADLQAAGLHPLLAVGGMGAAQSSHVNASPAGRIEKGGSTILEQAVNAQTIRNMKAQNELIEAQTANINSETQFNIESLFDRKKNIQEDWNLKIVHQNESFLKTALMELDYQVKWHLQDSNISIGKLAAKAAEFEYNWMVQNEMKIPTASDYQLIAKDVADYFESDDRAKNKTILRTLMYVWTKK